MPTAEDTNLHVDYLVGCLNAYGYRVLIYPWWEPPLGFRYRVALEGLTQTTRMNEHEALCTNRTRDINLQLGWIVHALDLHLQNVRRT